MLEFEYGYDYDYGYGYYDYYDRRYDPISSPQGAGGLDDPTRSVRNAADRIAETNSYLPDEFSMVEEVGREVEDEAVRFIEEGISTGLDHEDSWR